MFHIPAATLDLLGITIDMIGSVLIGYAALRVHHRFLNEHRVDKRVFQTMKIEQRLGVLGIVLVIIGYLIQILT
jgi:uncharacterized membrane protein